MKKLLSFIYIFTFLFFSCEDMRVENGFAVSRKDTKESNGIYYAKDTNISYGYVEVDVKIGSFQSEYFQIFMRGQPSGGNENYYLCQFVDPNNTGDITVVSVPIVDGDYSVDQFCANPGGQIEASINHFPTTGLKDLTTLGCEIVRIAGVDYLRSYLNRQMITEYVIGSGRLEEDCATASVDPVHPPGRVGFGWADQTDAKAASKNIKVNEFRLYTQRPF